MNSEFDHVGVLVYEQDRDRYLSALFAAERHRPALLALYAFNAETARVRDLVSDPLPGEVRLQWWRDLFEGVEHGTISGNPVAAALVETVSTFNLPVPALKAMLDARIFDLYDDPMPTMNDLEGYAGETASALIQLGSLVLNDGEDANTAAAAGHAGVAYALVGLMRALPWHAARRQMYLPADLLARHGVDVESVFRGEATPELGAALSELRSHARHHLDRLRSMIDLVPAHVAPAFLPLALVEPFLKRMEKRDIDPLKTPVEIPQWRRQLILWRAARKSGTAL